MNTPISAFTFAAGISIAVLTVGCRTPENPNPKPKGAVVYHGVDREVLPSRIPPRCSPAWNEMLDAKLGISDGSGHGPDIGSGEWMNAVGRKSGVVDADGHGPDPGSDEWCRAVDFKVFGRR